MIVNKPPEIQESESGKYICTLRGPENSIYRVKSTGVVIGRTITPIRAQTCDLGIGPFKNISRKHCILRFNTTTKAFSLEILSKNGVILKDGNSIRRKEIIPLNNLDKVLMGSSYFILSYNDSTLNDSNFRLAFAKRSESKKSWIFFGDKSDLPGQDQYDMDEVNWQKRDSKEYGTEFRSPVVMSHINEKFKKKTSKLSTNQFYKTYSPCSYKCDDRVGYDPNYRSYHKGCYYDIRSFLSWTVLKIRTWNIKDTGLLDPRIEYGTDIRKFQSEVEKWDIIYLGLRFFIIKDLISLGTIMNCRVFLSFFFKKSHLREWRSDGKRDISRNSLERIFVGLKVANPHRSLLAYQKVYGSTNKDEENFIITHAKQRLNMIQQFDEYQKQNYEKN